MKKNNTIRINRQELAGAFGDVGTDLPIIIAMIIAAGLYAPGVLIVMGLLQIFSGLVYRMPMPVQPLKAMAALVIAQEVAGEVLFGAGLAIGVVMLVLSITSLLTALSRLIPKAVVRGIQLGLGIVLCLLAFKKYIPDDGMTGYILAAVIFVVIILFIDNKRFPASLLAIGVGIVYAFAIGHVDISTFGDAVGIHLPAFHLPALEMISKGFVLLTLPQIPLSLGNSIIATQQMSRDLFPERRPLSIRKIGFTYGLMNVVAPFLGGIPCCHGSGGMAGHYTFGGRTGGSVICYGIFYVVLGLFFGEGFMEIVRVFPLPVLGVILVFEGVALMTLIKDTVNDRKAFVIVLLTGILAAGLPYGFVIALVVGTALHYLPLKITALTDFAGKKK